MFRSLYGKLALALLLLLGIIGLLCMLVALLTARLFVQEVNQNLDRDVAKHMVAEVPLLDSGEVQKDALEDVFHMMMVVNPSIEVYLLDPEGKILAYSAPPGKVKLEYVPLEPIHRFLEGPANMPVISDDPRHPDVSKAFSAAPIEKEGELEGYLYVVLGGEQYDSAVQLLQGSFVLRLGVTVLLAALLFALVTGLLLFALLTRRLRKLVSAMDAFQKSGFTAHAAPVARPGAADGDEIDRLGATFDTMAGRMIEQLQELKQADSLRRELVANVSHDLRTPLAAVQGYLETLLLKEGKLSPEEQRRYLETSLRHSDSLGKLVSELFELAKLEAAETRPNPEPFALPDLVQDVTQKYRLEAEKRRISLKAELMDELPFVLADIGLIERVLENLIDNALRYTPADGEITLSLRRKENVVEVEVADTGAGIPEEELPHIFDRFYRSKGGRSIHEGGSGLGLAISRAILDLHGSGFDVRSEVGRGTSFRFDLPLQ